MYPRDDCPLSFSACLLMQDHFNELQALIELNERHHEHSAEDMRDDVTQYPTLDFARWQFLMSFIIQWSRALSKGYRIKPMSGRVL